MKAFVQAALIVFSFTSLAYALPEANVSSSQMTIDEVIEYSQPLDQRFKLFLGVGLGYTDNSDDLYTEGYPKQFKVDGAYYTDTYPFVFDLSLGMSNQSFTKSHKANASGFVFEAASRFRFDHGYQAGAVLHTLMNQADNFHANGNNALFLGVQALKEFLAFDNRYTIRLGAKLMTDMNIPGEIVNVGMLEAAIGFPLFATTNVLETTSFSERDRELVSPRAIDTAKRDLRQSTMVFDLNSVKEKHSTFTQHLHRTLQNNPHLYGRVEKVGNELVFHDVTNEIALQELLKSVQ